MNPANPEDRAKEAFFDFLSSEEFDGSILISTSLTNSGEEILKARLENLKELPMVSIGPSVIGEDNVIIDNRYGMLTVMRHLLEQHGYRKFAYVSGPHNNIEARCRLESYRSALEDAGITHSENEEYEGNFVSRSGTLSLSAELRIRSSCGCVELERRRSTRSSSEIDRYSDIRNRIFSFMEGSRTEKGARELYRAWVKTIHTAQAENRTMYELEEILRQSVPVAREAPEKRANRLTTLYALLLEECIQADFMGSWKDAFFDTTVRNALERLQYESSQDLSLASHPDLFMGIAEQCRADALHVIAFRDGERPEAGAEVIFSHDRNGMRTNWSPGTGSWFPDRGRSLVANMITAGVERFGYFILDAHVGGIDTFEKISHKLTAIFRDVGIIKNIRQLNIEMAREIEARQESERKLKEALTMVEHLSIEDELTRLHNRRGFLTLAEQQIKYLRREKQGFFLLFVDLDGLKIINEKWGHKDGDIAIQAAAKVLSGALRDSDIIARLGGDEFTALASKVNTADFKVIKKRIYEFCDRMNEELGKEWELSMCVGHYYADPNCDLDVETMLDKADAHLYKQKQSRKAGRNEG